MINLRLQYPVNFKQSNTSLYGFAFGNTLQYPVNFKQSNTKSLVEPFVIRVTVPC